MQAGASKKAAAAVPAAKKEPEGPPDVSRLDIRVRGRGGRGEWHGPDVSRLDIRVRGRGGGGSDVHTLSLGRREQSGE